MEDYRIELKDGATKLFVTTKGTHGEISEELRKILSYVDGKGVYGMKKEAME